MRKILIILGLVVATLGWAGSGTETGQLANINVDAAATLIQEQSGNASFVILDVRTPEEFAAGHVEGAINIDYYREDFRDLLDGLDRDRTYLVYCRSGNRSGRTMPLMEELGFVEAYNLLGGFNAAAGVLPTSR